MGHTMIIGDPFGRGDRDFIDRGDQVFELLPDGSEVEIDEDTRREYGYLFEIPENSQVQEDVVCVSGLSRITNWLRRRS
jgi:hypothetical protein